MRERRRRNAMPADARARVSADLRRALDARPEVSSACLHGSFAAGGPFRDVDVAVWLEPAALGESGGWQYASTLAQDLERATGVPVDVQVLNDAPLGFRYHALRGEPLLVRDWDFFDDLRARTWDDYFDFRPFARQYLREVLGA
jgi:predicted nucleotidyltransferase